MAELTVVSSIAAEIDRLVIRGHELANDYADKPEVLREMAALPHLLSTSAIVLLAQPQSRDTVKGIIPYTPPSLVDAVIDDNVSNGLVSEEDGQLVLTDKGRAAGEATVALQEDAVARGWSDARDHVEAAERVLRPVVERAQTLSPPRTPSNFALFAPHCSRPTIEGSVLRLMTAVRYWRADAHLRAIDAAGLSRPEAHALNVFWDSHRGVQRIGQGFGNAGRKATASLEERGLADGGTITSEGVASREKLEEETDRLTAPLYAGTDDASLEELLRALRTIAGGASPGVPGT